MKSNANERKKAYEVLDAMQALFPEGETELENWETPFQLLITIILSAQTTDAQVNTVTAELFAKYPDSKRLGAADIEDVLNIIYSVNYNRSKAKNIIKAAEQITEDWDGKVPRDVDDLLSLAGVGRKTANVFLNNYYKDNQGIGVDTHILRVSNRLGLSKQQTPEGVAADLEAIYDQDDWWRVNNLFVLYGRYYCKARMSKSQCVFKDFCSYCSQLEN